MRLERVTRYWYRLRLDGEYAGSIHRIAGLWATCVAGNSGIIREYRTAWGAAAHVFGRARYLRSKQSALGILEHLTTEAVIAEEASTFFRMLGSPLTPRKTRP